MTQDLQAEKAAFRYRLPPQIEPVWVRYVFAVLAFGLAFAIRHVADPWLVEDRGLIVFLPAIAVTIFFAGTRAGILTAALSLAAICFFFARPFQSFEVVLVELGNILAYVLAAGAIGLIVHWLRLSILELDAERARSASLARERASLIDADPSGILVFNSKEEIRLVNRQLEELFGYAREELIGASVKSIIPALGCSAAGPSLPPSDGERETHGVRKSGESLPIEMGFGSFSSPDGELFLAAIIDISERKEVEKQEKILKYELQHRIKNLFAVIQGLVSRTLRNGSELKRPREILLGRLHALARANDLVMATPEGVAKLAEIVNDELHAYVDQVVIDGTDVKVDIKRAQGFALVVHELATNAAKYGALSVPDGQIQVCWSVTNGAAEPHLKFSWLERGGPRVEAPTKKGFGTFLLGAALGTSGKTEYPTSGLRYEVDVALSPNQS